MAYQTGTVTTASGLMTNIGSFLIGAGWQLHDDVSADHRVYFSSGASGSEDLYVGIEKNIKDYETDPFHTEFQNQEAQGAHLEHVNVSLYQHWNAGTNTPTNEVDGRIGPWLMYWRDDGATTDLSRIGSYVLTMTDIGQTVIPNQFGHQDIDAYRTYLYGCKVMGPERRLYMSSINTDLTQVDIVNNTGTWINSTWNEHHMVMAYDEAGIPHFFGLNEETAQNPTWRKTPVGQSSSHSYLALANPPAGQTTYRYVSACWDGNDYIYVTRGQNSTIWYRYSISGDSWITMSTALPASPNRNYTSNTFTYINKNSDIGVSEGWTSDKIGWYPGISTTNGFWLYDVTGESWADLANLGAMPESGSGTRYGKHYFLSWGGNGTNYYRYDIDTDTWVGGNNLPATAHYGNHLEALYRYQNQIPVDLDAPTSYWLFGDKEHFICVTKLADGTYWGFYCGTLDSYYPTQTVEVTSSVTAGSSVSITVSGNYDQFDVGKPLYITDVTGGVDAAEPFTLTSATGNTLTANSLDNNYSVGSIIGIDPQNIVMTCNYFDTVFCLHGPLGQGGRTSATAPYDQNYMQSLVPTGRNIVNTTAPGGRGQVQIWPIMVSNFKSEDANTDTNAMNETMDIAANRKAGAGSPTDPPEVRGQLRNMYCISDGTAPDGPISEDELVIGSDRYIVFKLYNMFDEETGHDMFVAIGPKV